MSMKVSQYRQFASERKERKPFKLRSREEPIRVGIRYMDFDRAKAVYPDFFETMKAGWLGDMTTVEMWFLANEV